MSELLGSDCPKLLTSSCTNREVTPEQPPCEQREIIAWEVVQAVEAVYQAKAKMDEAAKSKEDRYYCCSLPDSSLAPP